VHTLVSFVVNDFFYHEGHKGKHKGTQGENKSLTGFQTPK